jgi:predicted RNA methylase
LLRSIAYTERRGKEDIFEPYTSPFIRPDFSRFQRVLRKITKVLYYRIANSRLPDEYVVLVNPVVRPDELPRMVDRLRSDEFSELQPADEYEVFKFMPVMKGESRTEWLMQFYNWAVFHTWTLPTCDVMPGDTGMPPISKFRLELF